MCDGDDSVRVITALLLKYIAAHPEAADGIEGIRRWWLPSDVVSHLADVEVALEQLVQEGKLTRRPLREGSVLYAQRYL